MSLSDVFWVSRLLVSLKGEGISNATFVCAAKICLSSGEETSNFVLQFLQNNRTNIPRLDSELTKVCHISEILLVRYFYFDQLSWIVLP